MYTATVASRAGKAGADGIIIFRFSGFVDAVTITNVAVSGTQIFRNTVTIALTLDNPAKVIFLERGKRIPGCVNLRTSGSGVNNQVTCTFKPSTRNANQISATVTPNSAGLPSYTANVAKLLIGQRTDKR
jgi:hypothetical protein